MTMVRSDFDEAELSVDEFTRRIQAPLTEEEKEATLELVRWFTRRYPTAKERLCYARRAFARWTRPMRVVERQSS
jgi:hypothetical protein